MVESESAGTGPFRVKDWQADSTTTVTRFEDYWGGGHPGGEAGRPYLDGLRISPGDDATQSAAFIAGELDILSRNDRIQAFNRAAEWQASYGTSGDGPGQFKRPNAVHVDGDGDIYVCDRENDRVQILAPDGRFRAVLKGDHQISDWGKSKLNSNPDMIRQRTMAITHDGGAFEKALSNPCAVRVTPSGQIAILDHTRGRIQVYQKEKEPVLL